MSILTIAWSVVSTICATLWLLYLFIWVRGRDNIAYLLFSFSALGAAGVSIMELLTLRAHDTEMYSFLIRWTHVPIFILLVSLVWFIVVYFGTARRWLAYLITSLWVLALLINFLSPHSLAYSDISGLKQVDLPWGESFSIAIGTTNPWKYIPDTTSLLIMIFVVDASIRLMRRGNTRRALVIGGSTAFFLFAAGIHTPLVDEGIISTPYLISFAFLAIILAMAFQLTSEVLRASILSKETLSKERRWRSLLENVQLLVVGLDQEGKVNYANPYYLKLTGFYEEEIIGKLFTELVPETDRKVLLDTFHSSKTNILPNYRNTIITKAGNEHIVSWSNVGLYDSDGSFSGTLSIGADITEQEKAFNEIEQLRHRLQEESIYLQEEITMDHNYNYIIGKSDPLKYVLTRVEHVAPTDATVLIEGETGVGKELIARAIHQASHRKDRPLIKVNCAAIPDNLVESELFGHVKGAFTGADKDRKGRFELADKGTILLDEIGEVPLEIQSKLLRVLEFGEFEPLGSSHTVKVDARVITATNRVLFREVKEDRFREDLFYRLNVYPISVPPLRKRKEDIPLLVEFIVDNCSKKLGKKIERIPTHTMERLKNYSWPGNVRELNNVIERAVISARDSKLTLVDGLNEELEPNDGDGQMVSNMSFEEMERSYITKVLKECNWRVEGEKGAAKILVMHPNTLRNRMIKLGIKRPS